MPGKDYVQGVMVALLWWALILAALFAVACFAPQQWNMRIFILLMAACWPLLAGFCAGWRDGKRGGSGFAVALRWMIVPLLLLAALWWWLFPQLWQGLLYGKLALFVLIAAIFSGGLGAGIAKARQAFYLPRPDNADDDDTVDDTDEEDNKL